MTKKQAELLAIRKLNWQVVNGYRKSYSMKQLKEEAKNIYYLHNTYKGGDMIGKTDKNRN